WQTATIPSPCPSNKRTRRFLLLLLLPPPPLLHQEKPILLMRRTNLYSTHFTTPTPSSSPLFSATSSTSWAPYVAIQGMRVFSREKKRAMRDKILTYAVPLGCDQYGSIALNAIIRDVSFLYCSVALFDVVASKARFLSYSRYGNIVVQQVLKHCSLHSPRNIGASLRGQYVELSFTEGGRYIVEKILERDETGVLVMTELLECGRDNLVRLATSEYGHFVVETALKVTRGVLFRGLVNKLKPFLPLLRTSPQSTTVAQILESVP
ncbi:unnamed protein product, partial [Brassica oleracea]